MRRWLVIACLILGAPSMARAAASSDSAAVRTAIDAGNAAFLRAWQTGDADLFASLFATDGALLRPGGGLTVGRENIRGRMKDVFSRVRMTYGAIATVDVFVIGNVAYETGLWNFTIGPLGSTTAEPDSGNYVEVWTRDKAGAWRMWRDIGVPKGAAPPVAPPPVVPEVVPKAPPGQGTAPGARVKAIRFGKLLDGKGHTLTDALVVVVGDRIRSVSGGSRVDVQVPSDAVRIDLTKLTAIPGMIDAHTHMTYWWDQAKGSRPWQELDARAGPGGRRVRRRARPRSTRRRDGRDRCRGTVHGRPLLRHCRRPRRRVGGGGLGLGEPGRQVEAGRGQAGPGQPHPAVHQGCVRQSWRSWCLATDRDHTLTGAVWWPSVSSAGALIAAGTS